MDVVGHNSGGGGGADGAGVGGGDGTEATAFAPGQRVKLRGLTSRPALNDSEASIVRWDAKLGRWRVRTDSGSCLALKPVNIESLADADLEPSAPPPPSAPSASAIGPSSRAPASDGAARFEEGDLVVLKASGPKTVRLVVGVSECGSQIEVRAEALPNAAPKWVAAAKAEPLPPAPAEAVPTEFLMCRVQARDPHAVPAGRRAPADVVDVRIDPAGKLRFQVRWTEGGSLSWLKQDRLAHADAPTKGKRGRSKGACASNAEEGDGEEGDGEGDREGDAASGGGKANKRAKPGRRKGKESAAESTEAAMVAAMAGIAAVAGSDSSGKWSKRHARAADAWEEALNALQPDSEEEEEGEGAGGEGEGGKREGQGSSGGQGGTSGEGSSGRRQRKEAAAASAPAPAATRDPRLQGFRIGGQSETAEERGEGWCGPWSTARALLERRAQAIRERIDELGGAAPPPLVKWEPKTEPRRRGSRRGGGGLAGLAGGGDGVLSLQAMAVQFVAANIDCVDDFGWLTPAVQHALATELCRRRLFGNAQLRLLAPDGVPLSELVAPDCHNIDREALHEALAPLAEAGSRLGLLSLGFCGRCVHPSTSLLISRMPSLHSLTLTGAYRLSDACVSAIASTRSSALRTLTLSGNSQLGLAAVQAIADHCVNLERLALEDMAHLRSPALLPLGILTKLTSLSFRGLMLLDGPGMLTASVGSAPLLQSLQLSGCGMIKGAEVATAAEAMPCLRDLNLDGVELLTDDDLVRIADCRRGSLSSLTLRKCVQLSDAAIECLASSAGKALTHLSLNNVPAIGDAALVALAQHCSASLEHLDVSWCRAVSEDGLGHLVDACPRLSCLHVWGCTQITDRFHDGHSRHAMRVVGRGLAR